MADQVLIVNDIPAEDVELMTAVYKKAKATKVESTKQPDGRFTIKATFPKANPPPP
jgi:hypothetical protein